MKRLELTKGELRTLRDMGVFHSHPRTRMRAQAIARLSQGLTLQQVADEFGVHLNSVEQWRQRWNKAGLAGLYEGGHSGRPPKWNEVQRQALCELAEQQGGTAGALLRHFRQNQQPPAVSVDTIKRYLKKMDMRYQRCRYSLKKRDEDAFEHAGTVIASLRELALGGQCALLYFDESGFSPNPPLQYGWSRIGQSRCVEPQAHQQRVNVLGALRHDGRLMWVTQQRPTIRDDVIAFFDRRANSLTLFPALR